MVEAIDEADMEAVEVGPASLLPRSSCAKQIGRGGVASSKTQFGKQQLFCRHEVTIPDVSFNIGLSYGLYVRHLRHMKCDLPGAAWVDHMNLYITCNGRFILH